MDFIQELLKERGKLHFTLIDPDKQNPKKAGELAALAESYGTDAIMVGGSTADSQITDECVKEIKQTSKLPVILFPSTAGGVSSSADYLFFMMLLNSNDRRFLVGEQVKAAPFLKQIRVKPISMGYIIISTSEKPTTVEKVGDVDKILEDDYEKAISYALTAQYYGMSCIYLEAGSGADKPISNEMIRQVRKNTTVPIILGGGIRDSDTAGEKIIAGADVIVTGTILEKNPKNLEDIIKSVKK